MSKIKAFLAQPGLRSLAGVLLGLLLEWMSSEHVQSKILDALPPHLGAVVAIIFSLALSRNKAVVSPDAASKLASRASADAVRLYREENQKSEP